MLTETTEETTDNNGWADENMNQNENGKECKSLCYKYKTEKGYLCNNPYKGTFGKKKWCKIDKEDVLKNNLTLTEPNKNVLGQYWDYIEEEIPGTTVGSVLTHTQWDPKEMSRRIKAQLDAAIKSDRLKPNEGMRLLSEYERTLNSYTYLNFS